MSYPGYVLVDCTDIYSKAKAVFDSGKPFKFIPCYRKADGEIGVYEVYTSTFYPNEGLPVTNLVAG